jgi:hypothetical protein
MGKKVLTVSKRKPPSILGITQQRPAIGGVVPVSQRSILVKSITSQTQKIRGIKESICFRLDAKMERGATEENEDKPFAILCWPSELCTAPVPAGWIVGWSSSRKRSRNDSHEVIVLNEAIEEEEEWPYHAFVCAGIVPWTNNPTRTECESTLRRVRTRIGTIRDDLHQRGCSCSHSKVFRVQRAC